MALKHLQKLLDFELGKISNLHFPKFPFSANSGILPCFQDRRAPKRPLSTETSHQLCSSMVWTQICEKVWEEETMERSSTMVSVTF